MLSAKDFKVDTSVEEALKIGDRTLYVVTRTLTCKISGGNFFTLWRHPVAVVIVEPPEKYFFPLTSEDLTLDELFKMAPSLKEILEPS